MENKKFSQTTISSFFGGCGPKFASKIGRCRKSTSKEATPEWKVMNEKYKPVFLRSQKPPRRKLVAPIFTDDEDDDEFENNSNESSSNINRNVSPAKVMCLNTPSKYSPKKTVLSQWTSTMESTTVFLQSKSPSSESDSAISIKEETISASKVTDYTRVSANAHCSLNDKSVLLCSFESNDSSRDSGDGLISQTVEPTLKIKIEADDTQIIDKSAKTEHEDAPKKLNMNNLRIMNDFYVKLKKSNHLNYLLTKQEHEVLNSFFSSSEYCQFTCIKLFTWKPVWYNVFKFAKRIGLPIDDRVIFEMYQSMSKLGFVSTDYTSYDVHEILNYLDLNDLRQLCRSFMLKPPFKTKEQMSSKLLKNCFTQSTLSMHKSSIEVLKDRIAEKMGHCMKISNCLYNCLFKMYITSTFSNASFSSPQEYFTNVGFRNVEFPKYEVEDFVVFPTEKHFSSYVDAVKLRNELEMFIEKKNYESSLELCKHAFEMLKALQAKEGTSFNSVSKPYHERFTAISQYISVLITGIKFLTSKYHPTVKTWLEYLISQNYCRSKRGFWFCQLSLILTTYLKAYEDAAKLVISTFRTETDLSETQLHELANRGKILNKKTYKLSQLHHDQIASLSPPSCDCNWPHIVVDRTAIRENKAGYKRKYVEADVDGVKRFMSVEESALEYYANIGYSYGKHCEGGLICGAFCLLFWDIIYLSYVPGTFLTEVQSAPLDMYTKYFYANRKDGIDSRLESIRCGWTDEEMRQILAQNWNEHAHELSLVKVDASIDDPEVLFKIIMCIGRKVVARIFERLVVNYREHHSGFPDLLVCDFQNNRYKISEVKGENDRLSIKQKLWIKYLMEAGADVEVCYIHSIGSKKQDRVRTKVKDETINAIPPS